MRPGRLAWAIAAVAFMTSPAHAEARPSGELTVEAPKKVSPREMEALVSRFARSVSEPSRLGQLSRWTVRPCPRVLGLEAAGFSAFVEARITSVAEAARAPTRPKCRAANIFVLFTDQPQQLVDAVARKRALMLGFHFASQTRELTRFQGPVQAWYVTASGAREHATARLDEEFEPAQGGLAGLSRLQGGRAGSRLTSGFVSHFEAVMVVVDRTRVSGQPIGRVADQIAVRSLARSRPAEGCQPLATILDSLKPDCPASAALEGLSSADAAYIKALYSADPTDYQQRGEIVRQMNRELEPPR